jgi:F0F1-type ATP synthase epsilon subunit
MADKKLTISVKGTDAVLWEGEGDSVSSKNSEGPFDILPMHTNFISVVENAPIVVRMGRDKKEFSFPFSVIYAHSNTVFIYTNL